MKLILLTVHTLTHSLQAIIVVYDVHDITTFEHAAKWIEEVRGYAHPTAKVLLVGNKQDSRDTPMCVSEQHARAFAEQQGCSFVLASAKADRNVDMVFDSIVRQFMDQPSPNLKRRNLTIDPKSCSLTPVTGKSSSSGCFCL